MYYIYHIKGVKIGVSTEPQIRVKNQGYIDFEILEEHTDINLVSNRETELQKEYGYRVDRVPYKISSKQTKPYTLTLDEQKYVQSHYYKANNQFTKIPKEKYTSSQLANMFGVTKRVISLCVKRGISQK